MAILKSILNLLKMHRRSGKASGTGETRAVIIPREKNPIRKSDISQNAVRVLRVLNDAGYEAYLVGGGIRDLILGRHPKDFDVTTNATPEQVKRLFRNCRIKSHQAFCYIDGLTLENCIIEEGDLVFELCSNVNISLANAPMSIKNPISGRIKLKGRCEIILDEKIIDPSQTSIIFE